MKRYVIPFLVGVASAAQGQGTTPQKPAPVPASPQAQAPAQAPAQGTRPVQAPKRRALDIRAQAPAPEVVTVRPRVIPEFTRALISPALYRPGPDDTNRGAVVIFPGTLPIIPPATRAAPRPPEQPDTE